MSSPYIYMEINMTTTIKLTDTQRQVLQHAIDHTDNNVVWFPEQVKGGARIKVIQALEHKGLIAGNSDNWQVTDVGYESLGLAPPKAKATHDDLDASQRTRSNSKQATIVRMLQRAEGSTIAQIIDVTGWQAHTVRGALSGSLKKRLGLAVTSQRESDQARVYRIM